MSETPSSTAGISYISHGTVIRVRCADAGLRERIATSLPIGATLCDDGDADAVYTWTIERARSSRPVHVVTMRCRRYLKGRDIARTTNLERALALLNHDAEFRVAMYAPEDVFIHAAVAAWAGRAILLPGYSFAGKSMLAAELVRLGTPYFSDEFAVLDAAGRVRPFARRLQLRTAGGTHDGRYSAEELGGTRAAGPLPVGCVAATRYVAGARWDPLPLSRGQMVLALLEHAIDAQARPTHVLERIVRALGPDVVGLRGDRGEASDTARQILDRLTHRASDPLHQQGAMRPQAIVA